MSILFFVIPALLLVPVFLYMFFWFCRFFSMFAKITKRVKSTASALLSILCIALAWPLYGFGGVVILHFLAISIIIDIIFWLVKRKKEISVRWDKIRRSGIFSVLIFILMMTYGYINMHSVRETDYAFASDKIDKSLRIGAISDLHLGMTIDARELKKYCDKLEEREIDVLVLAGDIFDERTSREEMQKAAQVFGAVKSTYGTYYVSGNHDYNIYVEEPEYTFEELVSCMEAAGVTVLQDEAVTLEGLTIVGRRDASQSGRKEIEELIEGVRENSLILLLEHQPVGLQRNADAGVDLQISGHTHAGQIWPTGFLMRFLGMTEMNYGYQMTDNMHTIVTSGIAGWGYPVRTGSHCEYVIIDVNS